MKGAALAARDDMVELAKLLTRAVGVKDGESTLRVFLGLNKHIESAISFRCSLKTQYHGAVLSRRRLWFGRFRILFPISGLGIIALQTGTGESFDMMTQGFD